MGARPRGHVRVPCRGAKRCNNAGYKFPVPGPAGSKTRPHFREVRRRYLEQRASLSRGILLARYQIRNCDPFAGGMAIRLLPGREIAEWQSGSVQRNDAEYARRFPPLCGRQLQAFRPVHWAGLSIAISRERESSAWRRSVGYIAKLGSPATSRLALLAGTGGVTGYSEIGHATTGRYRYCPITGHNRRGEICLGLEIRSGRARKLRVALIRVSAVPADIGLHCALLVETHPLYRDGTNIPALENRGGESSTTAGSPFHFRDPQICPQDTRAIWNVKRLKVSGLPD